MSAWKLPLRNLARKPGRTLLLILLTGFLALSVFGGSLVVFSLRQGLSSMENRLGADIIVVPAEAKNKVGVKNMLLSGALGEYYMDASVLDRVRQVEGVEQATGQIFLASMKAECCSVLIQVIGFDPENDFVVQPWIEESYRQRLEKMDVVVGCQVETDVGHNFKIYDQYCDVVARLAPTGTAMDTAVYCNLDTIHALLLAAEEKGISHKVSADGERDSLSAIYLKTASGAQVDRVSSAVLKSARKIASVPSKGMFTEIGESLSGVNRMVGTLILAVWVLALLILGLVFILVVRERRREFAVLRLLGTSRSMLRSLIRRETALCSLAGALAGIGVGALVVYSFAGLIEKTLNLPWLAPSGGKVLLLAGGTLLATVLAGALISAGAAGRLSRVDPGTTLREGN